MKQKTVFIKILIFASLILMLLPGLVMFSSILTGIFNQMRWYVVLQEHVVPFEARMVAVIIKLARIKSYLPSEGEFPLVLEKPEGGYLPVALEWNCLGWQSMVLLGLTLATGLKGKWKIYSKIETITIGIVGTLLVNLLRMSLIIVLAYYWNNLAIKIIHDYFASLVAIIWMLFFWWFSYSYVLEEKSN